MLLLLAVLALSAVACEKSAGPSEPVGALPDLAPADVVPATIEPDLADLTVPARPVPPPPPVPRPAAQPLPAIDLPAPRSQPVPLPAPVPASQPAAAAGQQPSGGQPVGDGLSGLVDRVAPLP